MLGYYKRHISQLSLQLQELRSHPDDLQLLVALQLKILARIMHTEGKILRFREQLGALRRQLKLQRLSKDAAISLKRDISVKDRQVRQNQWLLFVWRCFGDGIAFAYLDKWAIKPLLYNIDNPQVKQGAGHITGKEGLRREIELLQRLASVGVPSVVRNNFILTALDNVLPTCENRRERQPALRKDTLAMTRSSRLLRHLVLLPCLLLTLLGDAARFLWLCLHPPAELAAENLFLRKQLALYREHGIKPRCAPNTTRIVLVWLSRWFDWRQALAVVQPATLIRWHRRGFQLCWRWKSRPGRPSIPPNLQALIRRMARENPTWGEERIANELFLKLGLRVSPRTVRKYLPKRLDHGWHRRVPSQRWQTFVHNHAQALVACDFCVVVTATFRLLYVFVVMEHATRRILLANATAHPTARWTLQQLHEAIPVDHAYRFLIHDRDVIFSQELDQRIRHLRLKVLKTPVRSPQANALCERLLGTLRRECLDFVIPLTENHLRRLLREWVCHYNAGRPHMALGPGIPQPPPQLPVPLQARRHHIPGHLHVMARSILGGLHHEYRLEAKVA
jgi:putative transposase